MLVDIARAGRTYLQNFRPRDRGSDHRAAVGGLWEALGPLQLDFMKRQGLKPHHRLLDIGCGSLRAGRLFIRYLDAGNYLGLDFDEPLVRMGLRAELDERTIADKKPCFVFNEDFRFTFQEKPDFAIAQSLFTHLTLAQIDLCLKNLGEFAPSCLLFASFNETRVPLPYFFAAHPRRTFFYTRSQIMRIGSNRGWAMRYIGDWGHPRQQKMARFEFTMRPVATTGATSAYA